MKCVKFNYEKKYVNDFINLSKKLYSKKNNMEDEKEIKKILTNTHPLSKYFKIDKFLIYENENIVGRFIITTYPNDNTAYLGYYECIEDMNIANYLFDIAYKYAKENGYERIVGPVDSSFWIKYRLKINMFEKGPYTGEPYNKEYYFQQFLNNKFEVFEHYTSNIYKCANYDYENEKYSDRYKEFTEKGYKIISQDIKDFDSIVNDVYYLLTNLYKDFPIYKDLAKEDFVNMFKSYKAIINMSMMKLAYYDNKMVGFFISIPNYNNIVYHLNILNITKILKIKKKPKEYIMLYMGVDQEHRGLGKALAGSIIEELKKNNLPSIGALARDGKVTQNYVEDMIENRYEYVLLERKVENEYR